MHCLKKKDALYRASLHIYWSVIFYLLVAAWGSNLIATLIDSKSFYEKTSEVIVKELNPNNPQNNSNSI